MLTSMPSKSEKLDNLKAIFSKYTQPIRRADLKDALISSEGIKKAMAYRHIQNAIDMGILVENNVGMLYYKKDVENEGEKLPF